MSQYFTAAFFSESGFPSKITYEQYCIVQRTKTDPINDKLLVLVKEGQNILKKFYNDNQKDIKKFDLERKQSDKAMKDQVKASFKKSPLKYIPIDLSDEEEDEITCAQPRNIKAERLEEENQQLYEQLNERDMEIARLNATLNDYAADYNNLRSEYKLLKNAYIDITIEYEKLRASGEVPVIRKRRVNP